jgi:hypothetical protein
MDAYWRAANYLSVGQIYLYDNPLRPGDRVRCDRRRQQRCALMKATQRVSAPRGGQPDNLIARGAGSEGISLRAPR